MNKRKTRIAAAATVVGLGGLTGIALSSGGQKASSLADKPLVRTKVIHRTIHVTKHLKPKDPAMGGGGPHSGGGPGSSAYGSATTGASSTGSGSYSSSPVSTGASSTGSHHSGSHAPVVTHTSGSSHSGSGGGGGGGTPVSTGPSGTGGAGGGESTPVTTSPSSTGGAGGGGEVEDGGGESGDD